MREVRRHVRVLCDDLLEARYRRTPLRVHVHCGAVEPPACPRQLRGQQQLQAQLRLSSASLTRGKGAGVGQGVRA